MFKPNNGDKNHPNDFNMKIYFKKAWKYCRKFNKHNNRLNLLQFSQETTSATNTNENYINISAKNLINDQESTCILTKLKIKQLKTNIKDKITMC